MEKIFETLKANPNFVLATIDSQGKPHTRIVQYLFEIGGEIYFCTNNTKKMSLQMKENNCISIIAYAPDFSTIARTNGTVTFLNDIDLKVRALAENPGIKSIYKDATNPIFEICSVSNLVIE